jgi:endonuclease/exonuclease/phosphatase family metal-dependent hydrolase
MAAKLRSRCGRDALRVIAAGCAAISLLATTPAASGEQAVITARREPSCMARSARLADAPIVWYAGPTEDRETLDRWCRAVGPPLLVSPRTDRLDIVPPALDDFAVMTWNAHLAEGDLADLIARLRDGSLTDGRPMRRFVLLIQELFRRGAEVPAFAADSRSAYAIKARDPETPDARGRADLLGLSMLYVPSMRNGADILEDRGNAIVSTEPLLDPFALELPLERQRRVVVGAAIVVSASGIPLPLNFVNVHFEPLSSPATLWVFRNPRQRQVAAVLELMRSPRFEPSTRSAGTVLGGDFNTIQGGVEEVAYMHARAWGHSLLDEDDRSTHRMGRIDYLFFRLGAGWTGSTVRVDDKFGSDHHPVLGRFAPRPQTP